MSQFTQYPRSATPGGGTEVTIVGPLGQTLMASSVPVVIASNQSAIPISQGGGLLSAGSVGSAITLFSVDTSTYNSVAVQVTSAGSACTITYEVSNDSTTWYAWGMLPSFTSNILVSTSTAVGFFTSQINANYFRARVSTYGSGTVSAYGYFKCEGNSPLVVTSQAQQSGTWSTRTQDGSGTALTSMTVGAKQGLDVNRLGFTLRQFITNSYSSVNVTTSAYVQLIASTSNVYQWLYISDTSGQVLKIAFGAALSEVDQFSIPEGGNGWMPIYIPASTRVSVKAISATASSGYLVLNLYG